MSFPTPGAGHRKGTDSTRTRQARGSHRRNPLVGTLLRVGGDSPNSRHGLLRPEEGSRVGTKRLLRILPAQRSSSGAASGGYASTSTMGRCPVPHRRHYRVRSRRAAPLDRSAARTSQRHGRVVTDVEREVADERAAQGLPPRITDPLVLRRVAALVIQQEARRERDAKLWAWWDAARGTFPPRCWSWSSSSPARRPRMG